MASFCTLGGDFSRAHAINPAGDMVGVSTTRGEPSDTLDPQLGSAPTCSRLATATSCSKAFPYAETALLGPALPSSGRAATAEDCERTGLPMGPARRTLHPCGLLTRPSR
jgi:hypothetical protein